jgi:hypothetical protein
LNLLDRLFFRSLEEHLGCLDAGILVFTRSLDFQLRVKSCRQEEDTQEAACVSYMISKTQKNTGAEWPEQTNETGSRSGMKPVRETHGDTQSPHNKISRNSLFEALDI